MENFLHRVFLGKCYLCDAGGDVICQNCLNQFIFKSCCSSKIFSFFEFNDIAKKLLYLSKYPPHYYYLLKYLSLFALRSQNNLLYNFVKPVQKNSILSSVPLSSLRLYERGFNQADMIAKTISSEYKIAHLNVINRIKDTSPLYELDKDERRKELEKAFKVNSFSYLLPLFKIKEVILIDDLLTTGQTFLQCSKALKCIGVEKVKLITLFAKK